MYFVQECLVEREIKDMLVKDKDELHQHMFEISDSVSSDSKFNQDNYFNNIKRPLLNNMNFIFNNKSIQIKCEDFDNQNHYFNNILNNIFNVLSTTTYAYKDNIKQKNFL